jgi:hypothetical protein
MMVPQASSKRPPLVRSLFGAIALCVTLIGAIQPARAAKPNGPTVSIPLEPLGYTTMPPRYLLAGATMFTVNFVDTTHLLVTFNSHALMPRLNDDPVDDDDRSVAAVLLELPSGKVLARTVWRTHDHERYLWPLTHGRFLLRIRTHLSVLAPLDNLAAGDAFHETGLVDTKRRIGFISISPYAELIAIQTLPPPQPPANAVATTEPGLKKRAPIDASDGSKADPAVQISLFRLRFSPNPSGPERMAFTQVGFLRAPAMIQVSATAEGFLSAVKQKDGGFAFDFATHSGKITELPIWDTSCAPRAFFVSRSEFVAFGCRSSTDHGEFSLFDLRGQEPWAAAPPGPLYATSLAPAPDAGRFAYSHIVITGANFDGENVVAEEMGAQEVTVYQNHDGRILLRTQTSPIQRAGQNFDLAADGQSLAVLRDGKVEVYNLPPLSGKDQKEIALAQAAAPPAYDGPILLGSVAVANKPPAKAVTVDTAKGSDAPAVSRPAPTAQALSPDSQMTPVEPSAENKNIVGDVPPNGPRKRPSLYSPEYPK